MKESKNPARASRGSLAISAGFKTTRGMRSSNDEGSGAEAGGDEGLACRAGAGGAEDCAGAAEDRGDGVEDCAGAVEDRKAEVEDCAGEADSRGGAPLKVTLTGGALETRAVTSSTERGGTVAKGGS
jgi:hypothetical protein